MELIYKGILSSDRSLQLDSLKSESLVIVNQHVTVNTFSVLVHTARHITRVCNTQSRYGNLFRSQAPTVGPMIGMKS